MKHKVPPPSSFAEYRQRASDVLEAAGYLADAAIASNVDYEGSEVKPLLDGWSSFSDLLDLCNDKPVMIYEPTDAWYDHTSDFLFHVCEYVDPDLEPIESRIEDAMRRLGYIV